MRGDEKKGRGGYKSGGDGRERKIAIGEKTLFIQQLSMSNSKFLSKQGKIKYKKIFIFSKIITSIIKSSTKYILRSSSEDFVFYCGRSS